MRRREKTRKVLAFILSAAVAFAYGATPAWAVSGKITKEETVFVATDASGTEKEVVVSDHLKNDIEADTINDVSDLTDIENVKGEETFEKGKGDQLIWKAGGKDIFYDGNSDKETPVTLDIRYRLNGEVVEGSELKGKSGDVEIKINFENHAKATVNGREVTVPFIAMIGFIANDDSFSDIEIDNGKVIDDGDKKMVVGMAAPGLAEALEIDEEKYDIDLDDSVVITGHAEKFDIQDIMTVVTNSVFEDVDMDDMDLDYDDEIKALDKGAKALVDGSEQLYEGLGTLDGSMPELKKGVRSLNEGSVQLRGSLRSQMRKIGNATGQLHDGTGTVLSGLRTIKKGLDKGDGTALNPGAIKALDQVAKGLEGAVTKADDAAAELQAASDQMSGGSKKLADGGAAMEEGATQASAGAKDLRNGAGQIEYVLGQAAHRTGQETQPFAFNEDVNDQLIAAMQQGIITQDTYVRLLSACGAGFSAAEGMTNAADGLDNAAGGFETGAAGMNEASVLLDGTSLKLSDASAEMKESAVGLEQASQAVTAVENGLKAISKSLGAYDKKRAAKGKDQNTIIGGMTVIDSGLGRLNREVTNSVSKQGKLTKALDRLVYGTDELVTGTDDLSDGVDQLKSGSYELKKGMNKFYTEGIRQLLDLYEKDIKGTLDGLKDVVDAGAEYKTFTRLSDDMDGNVKFIYKTTIYR